MVERPKESKGITDDEKRDRRMKQGLYFCPPVFALVCIARLICWRGLYKAGYERGKQAPLDLPKGIVITPEDLVLQLKGQAAKEEPSSGPKGETKELTGEWSGFREFEVVISHEEKRAAYVFDANNAQDTYVVLEVRGCTSGPPLMPTRLADGGLQWDSPADRFMHLSTYLAIAMKRLTGEDWSPRIFPHVSGNYLVRYQAVVREEHWRELWDHLLKPFAEQRSEYRRVHHTHRAPDLFFGVKAKACQPEGTPEESAGLGLAPEREATPVASDGKRSERDDTTTASDERRSDTHDATSSDGIPLPGAAEWLEFWQHTEIPQQRTFIEFASHLQTSLPRRSNSQPDLSRLRTDNSDSL